MKLKYSFDKMELDDQIVAVPVGKSAQEFRGIVKLNKSAAEIFDLLSDETTESAVVAELKRRYGEDSEISGFVHKMIVYLKTEGVLE